jgi:rhodanese-related sulfurtransferase
MRNSRILFQAVTIAAVSAALGFTLNSLSPNGVRFGPELALQDGITELTLVQAYEWFQRKEGVFVDARHEMFYKQQHIPGALHVYFKNAEVNPALESMDKERSYIVYCKSSRCDQAHRLARAMFTAGFKKIAIFTGGMVDWLDAGYPVESSQ